MSCNVAMCNSTIEPHHGLEFESHEAAYSFYKEYAKTLGFGTAKLSSRRSRASKEFIDAKFSCIRYGNKQQSDDAINPRPSPKIGCKASMHVKRKQNGKWYVYGFVKKHNHELLPAQVHFFRSHKDINLLKNDVKLRKKKLVSTEIKQFNAYQNVEYLESYLRSQLDKGRSLVLEANDARMLLDLFSHMQEENPKFFYAVDLNDEHRLRNVFWLDSKGIDDHIFFGDVVCLDTTYFTNKYRVPLVLFIGVNHHIQPILLGSALIADDTMYTFLWLMQTWRVSVRGHAPKVILSDQTHAIKASVSAVFPESQHCFCLWHILEKIPRHLDFLSLWHDTFMMKFCKCIFSSLSAGQFEKRWDKLVGQFNLRENQWFQSLYEDRTMWVPAFMTGLSLAGLSESSRSGSLYFEFEKYIHAESSLKEVMEQYRLLLENRYEHEAKADFDAWHETPELKSPSPFEKQMSLVYSPEIFKKFQDEVLGASACHLKKTNDHPVITYTVKDLESSKNFIVVLDQPLSEIHCTCRSFEYKGYLCRHAIVVLQMSGIFSIPMKYILQRWTNMATSRHPIGERLDEVQFRVRRFNDLCRRAIILGEEGSLSQESYGVALCAIRHGVKQCVSVNSHMNGVRGEVTSVQFATCFEENSRDDDMVLFENMSQSDANLSKKMLSGVKGGSESSDKPNVESYGRKKRKEILTAGVPSVSTQESFCLMELPDTRPMQIHSTLPLHSSFSMHLHAVMPPNIGISTPHFQIMPNSHVHAKHLPG